MAEDSRGRGGFGRGRGGEDVFSSVTNLKANGFFKMFCIIMAVPMVVYSMSMN